MVYSHRRELIFMKKLLCILLSVILLISLVGCFDDRSADDDKDDDDVRSTTASNEPTTPEEVVPEFSLGQTSGSTYTNDFLGVRFDLPTGWQFYTDEQILALNNIVGDYIDESVAEQLKNANIIYDMYAVNHSNGNSINVTMEKLNAVQAMNLDTKAILEGQSSNITTMFQKMGISNISIKYQKVTVGGKEHDGLVISGTSSSVSIYETMIAYQRGDYLVYITACSTQTDTSLSILNGVTFN